MYFSFSPGRNPIVKEAIHRDSRNPATVPFPENWKYRRGILMATYRSSEMRNKDMMDAVQGDITKAILIKQRVFPWGRGLVGGWAVALLKSSVARPVMATPTRVSASARLRTKHQLWLLFLRSSLSRAAATSRLMEMMKQEATVRITPITPGLTSIGAVGLQVPRQPGAVVTKVPSCPRKYDILIIETRLDQAD